MSHAKIYTKMFTITAYMHAQLQIIDSKKNKNDSHNGNSTTEVPNNWIHVSNGLNASIDR